MNLESFIQVYDDFLTKDECERLIGLWRDNAGSVEQHDTPSYKFSQLNLHTARLTHISQAFAKRVDPVARKYFEERNLLTFIPEYGYEEVRMKRYLAGGKEQFKTHVDTFDAASAKRFLIALVYLNDNDGNTEFPRLGISVTPNVGRLVLFPPTWMFPHSGNVPTDIDKYVIMTSLNYV